MDIIEQRQKIIDRLFPKDLVGCHKFNAKTCKCDQCGCSFAEWATTEPVMRLCPVIGDDELASLKPEGAE